MANSEHLAILRQGVDAWNEWRKRNLQIQPDLTEANLSAMDLRRANLTATNLADANFSLAHLTMANLSGANIATADLFGANLVEARLIETDLRGSDIRRADLSEAKLSNADLRGADLSSSKLWRTNLSGAKLAGAYLIAANFSGANLSEADLTGAYMRLTTFADVDLSNVTGLDNVKHWGPSSIGLDTIYRSRGNIPKTFLRGCGVPDNFITGIASLARSFTQFFSCFISHSSKDQCFCDRLYTDLQARGVRVWYFPEDARWGEPVWREIDRSIRIYDKLVVVCSENSLQSGPVLREIERALNREDREGKSILFPIRIDDYIFNKWAYHRKADVLARVVGDFSGWDISTAKYDLAFNKLLRAIEAGEAK